MKKQKVYIEVDVKDEMRLEKAIVFAKGMAGEKCVKYAHDLTTSDKAVLKEQELYVFTKEELEIEIRRALQVGAQQQFEGGQTVNDQEEYIKQLSLE